MNIIINGAGGRMGRALRVMAGARDSVTVAAAIDPFVREEGMLSALEESFQTGQKAEVPQFTI